jgi:CRISPR-associated protein Cas5t
MSIIPEGNMFVFSVTGVSITASFRVPETHTFHQTLPLPPKTTIIGMIGAALGLKLEDAHSFVDENNILVSVYGKHKGLMRDLWNYRKLTTKKFTVEQRKNRLHYSVLIREFLYDNEFSFYFASERKKPLENLRKAMQSPVYPITSGNSDDLFKLCRVSKIETIKTDNLQSFEHTIIPGDISKNYRHEIDLKDTPIVTTIYTPQVFLLPTRFEFLGDERRVIERKPFTFVSSPIETKSSIEGYVIDGKRIILQ